MPKVSLEERFWSKVEKTDNCWEWTSWKDYKGYGKISNGNQQRFAHHIAWELTHGPIPDGLCVLHHCDNPSCVNPDHLFIGTVADNNADMWKKGRGVLPPRSKMAHPGAKNGAAKLTRQKVLEIRHKYSNGITQSELSRQFGVSQKQIGRIVHRENWAWLE